MCVCVCVPPPSRAGCARLILSVHGETRVNMQIATWQLVYPRLMRPAESRSRTRESTRQQRTGATLCANSMARAGHGIGARLWFAALLIGCVRSETTELKHLMRRSSFPKFHLSNCSYSFFFFGKYAEFRNSYIVERNPCVS